MSQVWVIPSDKNFPDLFKARDSLILPLDHLKAQNSRKRLFQGMPVYKQKFREDQILPDLLKAFSLNSLAMPARVGDK